MKRVDFDASVANHNLNNKQFIVRRKTKIENKEAKDMKNIETRVDVRIECLLLLLIFLRLFNQTRTTFYFVLNFWNFALPWIQKKVHNFGNNIVSWIIYAIHKSISSHKRCMPADYGRYESRKLLNFTTCMETEAVWDMGLNGTA